MTERTPVELTIARHAVGRVLWIGPAMILAFWVLRGPAGAGAALLGLVIVVGNLLLAGALLSLSIRVSLGLYHAAALVGFFLRLGLITGSMLLVVRFIEVDRIAFGVSAVVGYLGLLVLEALAVARGRERKLDWVS